MKRRLVSPGTGSERTLRNKQEQILRAIDSATLLTNNINATFFFFSAFVTRCMYDAQREFCSKSLLTFRPFTASHSVKERLVRARVHLSGTIVP